MAKVTLNLVKAEYKHVDISRYYVSVNGEKMREITLDEYSRYFKSGFTIRSSSESYFDRKMIFRDLEIM